MHLDTKRQAILNKIADLSLEFAAKIPQSTFSTSIFRFFSSLSSPTNLPPKIHPNLLGIRLRRPTASESSSITASRGGRERGGAISAMNAVDRLLDGRRKSVRWRVRGRMIGAGIRVMRETTRAHRNHFIVKWIRAELEVDPAKGKLG